MNKLDSLSIFFPFWNEEKNVEKVVANAIPVAKKIAKRWEIIIVDDGSSDNTLELGKKIAKKEKNVRFVTHSPNRGYGAALKEGFDNAKYDVIVFTDGDGQFNFAEVEKFVEKIAESDLVIGFREKRNDNFIRSVLMHMLKIWDLIFFGFHFKDIDCGFKMFKKEAIAEILPLRSEGAMITTEILVKAKRKKLKITQVGVKHYPRKYGEQNGGNFFVITRAVLESLTLWWDLRNGRF